TVGQVPTDSSQDDETNNYRLNRQLHNNIRNNRNKNGHRNHRLPNLLAPHPTECYNILFFIYLNIYNIL
ncbi:MAG: hypothetical protein II001_04150, partial [Bacteroidales bacterium]|nr:hypothetical protein [Bacteroidales bacterium]